jgi:hypothetical protein
LSKWILQKGAIVVTSVSLQFIKSIVLINLLLRTSSKASRMKEFVDTEQVPDLTMAEMQAIDDAGSKLHKRHYLWDGQFSE